LKFKLFFIILCICILSGISFFAVHSDAASASSKTSRVLILPFALQSDSDLSFLRKGIGSMLYSRLSLSGKATLIPADEVKAALQTIPHPIERAAAFALGSRLAADYVLMGNLTVLGDNVSTDAVLLDVQKQAPALAFSQFGQNRGEAIGHINLFATQINEKIFGYRSASKRPAQYAGGSGAGYAPYPHSAENARIWKSRKFKTEIIALAVGDVDADGNNETVFVSDNSIFVYRFQEGAFRKISEMPGKKFERIISIDIGDINKNGKAEIFITNIKEKEKKNLVRSYVLEWDETCFREIAEKQKWFFRVIDIPQKGKTLIGQKIGMPPKLFSGGIFDLKWEGGDYVSDRQQELPKGIHICAFTFGDVLNDGMQRIVALDENDRIMLLNPDGKEEWSSSDRYGGSANYLEYPAELRDRERRDLTDHFYLPQRLHVADLDQDGKNEVLVVTNHDISKRLFQRFRVFDSGSIECLFWYTLGMQRKWKTQKVSGYISDYRIADLNNDGREELVFSVVKRGRNLRGMLGNKKSFIVSYDKTNP